MLIHEIVDYCNAEYRNADTTHLCHDCNHPSECSGSCKNCLEQTVELVFKARFTAEQNHVRIFLKAISFTEIT